MKPVFLLIIVSLNMTANSQTKLRLTMDQKAVSEIYPGMKSTQYQNTITLNRPEIVQGLDIDWQYRFDKGKFTSFSFAKYFQEDAVNAVNFEKCLEATKNQITDYTSFYGKPDQLKIGDTTFVNPYVKHHWGYEVMEAVWKNYEGMRIRVRFKFQGSKGIYFFIFTTEFEDKNQPD